MQISIKILHPQFSKEHLLIESKYKTTTALLEEFEECLTLVHAHMDNWAVENNCEEVLVFDSTVPPGDFRISLCESGVVIYTSHPGNVREGLALLVHVKSGTLSRLEAGPTRFYPPARTVMSLHQKLEKDPNATLDLYDALARTLPNADVASVLLVL